MGGHMEARTALDMHTASLLGIAFDAGFKLTVPRFAKRN
jgi:hypothetical protein